MNCYEFKNSKLQILNLYGTNTTTIATTTTTIYYY